MDKAIEGFFKGIKVGAKQSHKNLTLYCLLAADEVEEDFLTVDRALEEGALTVTEMDEAGTVPELRVRNGSRLKVLMLDGEELVGAKQNRVLNTTVLIAEESETVIPVSCVEQGRWSYDTPRFASARRAMSADLKRKKTRSVSEGLRTRGRFDSDQGMVWEEITDKFARMEAAPSATMAMADLYVEHEDLTTEYMAAFQSVDRQVGIAVFIDGRPAGVEILRKFDAFRELHSKLVSSYVMDALETVGRDAATSKASKARVAELFNLAKAAPAERRNSVALGLDLRLESPDIVAAGLEYNDSVFQMSVFLNDDGVEDAPKPGNMRKASRRRSSIQR